MLRPALPDSDGAPASCVVDCCRAEIVAGHDARALLRKREMPRGRLDAEPGIVKGGV